MLFPFKKGIGDHGYSGTGRPDWPGAILTRSGDSYGVGASRSVHGPSPAVAVEDSNKNSGFDWYHASSALHVANDRTGRVEAYLRSLGSRQRNDRPAYRKGYGLRQRRKSGTCPRACDGLPSRLPCPVTDPVGVPATGPDADKALTSAPATRHHVVKRTLSGWLYRTRVFIQSRTHPVLGI